MGSTPTFSHDGFTDLSSIEVDKTYSPALGPQAGTLSIYSTPFCLQGKTLSADVRFFLRLDSRIHIRNIKALTDFARLVRY